MGYEKVCFTVLLIASIVDGVKLKPFVVLRGVCPIPEVTQVSRVLVEMAG